MNTTIEKRDVETLRKVFDRLKKFHEEWKDREDDPEDMLIEAPEMAAKLVLAMEPVIKRLEGGA